MKSARRLALVPASVDPRLTPFLDALAEMLAADEARLDEARRALREIASAPLPSKKPHARKAR
jgi:hypothetical protein